MLGVVLIYVGVVLILNGVGRLCNVDAKSSAVFNVFTGMLSFILNIVAVIQGNYFAAGTGLLFGFTYLFVAVNSIFNLDPRLYGWYSLFVAINSVPAAYIEYFVNGDWRMAVIWILWGILWLTGFIENVLKKHLSFVPYLAIFEGLVTAWIPGFMILTELW